MATAAKAPPAKFIEPADMPDLYAVTGQGTCMEPLYADGALLVGDKRETPIPGDVVLVHFRREVAASYGMPGWVKRLIHVWPGAAGEDLITLEQINPRARYCIPSSHVAAMHKCVGTAVSGGDGTALFRLPKREA